METITLTQIENLISESKLTPTEQKSIDIKTTEDGFYIRTDYNYENKNEEIVKLSKKSYFKVQDFLCKLNREVAIVTKNLTVSII